MVASVLFLPVPLLLLVHLHILDYPFANNLEYDLNVFDPRVRGLRDRTKSMEDVCYFLVCQLEGSKDRVKKILPTYPCLQPVDTTAFRTALSKYLESLRHQSLHSSPETVSGHGPGKGMETNMGTVAWWWKDVVVRKSLIEECSGERFERLVLSLSTHALLKRTSSPSGVTPETTSTLLRIQPQTYTALLATSLSTRHTWSCSASLLLQRQDDVKLLRQQLASRDETTQSKYDSLSTQRLLSLADSKLHDLLREYWTGRGENQGLDFLTESAGLKPVSNLRLPASDYQINHPFDAKGTVTPIAPPPPLPIGAAHHPSNLRKISKPIFPTKSKSGSSGRLPDDSTTETTQRRDHSHASIALQHHLDAEMGTKQALLDTLSRAKKASDDLNARMRVIKTEGKTRALGLDLWEEKSLPKQGSGVDFNKQPTPDLFASLSLHMPPSAGSLESRIDHIRDSLLPSSPLAPTPPIQQLPPTVTTPSKRSSISRLPRPSPKGTSKPTISKMSPTSTAIHKFAIERAPSPPRTPDRTSAHPFTSTPPATVKPRSAYTQDILASQGRDERHRYRPPRASRRSIRFSLAITRRPSLFRTGNESEERDELEDEVDRIVRGVQDDSQSFNDIEGPAAVTPRPTATDTGARLNRASTVTKPKHSFPMPIDESIVALPSLISSSSSLQDVSQEEADHEQTKDIRIQNPNDPRRYRIPKKPDSDDEGTDDESLHYKEAPSMTLRDILLQADTTQFDLLEDDPVQLGDESIGWDYVN